MPPPPQQPTPPMAASQRPTNPYRDFLTPFLHRQFTNAAILALAVSYLDAILMGQWNLIWQWFPLGKAGLLTILIFISSLAVFILRVAQLHVGLRTTASPIETFLKHAISSNTLQTFAWYGFSAWWFSEIYIWSVPNTANFGWIDPGKAYERPRLNERPIVLRSLFLLMAVCQSIVHLYRDYGRVPLPLRKTDGRAGATRLSRQSVPPPVELRSSAWKIFLDTLLRVGFTLPCGVLIYWLFIRHTVMETTFFFARIMWTLPKALNLSIGSSLLDLMPRSFLQGLLLTVLWEFTNKAFSAFVAQEPLKNGHPLTDDSKDPNGSLLLGLKAKKEVPKSFAFRELNLISQRFPERRKSVFQDLDRVNGSALLRILDACRSEMKAITERIQAFQQPSGASSGVEQAQPEIRTLPKIAQPLKKENVVLGPPPPRDRLERIEREVGDLAKSYGQSPDAKKSLSVQAQQVLQYPTDKLGVQNTTSRAKELVKSGADKLGLRTISPQPKKLLQYGADKLMSKEKQEQLRPKTLKGKIDEYILRALQTPLGQPFRRTLSRRAAAVVLGTPYGRESVIVDAIQAISSLAVYSLKEDTYGQMQKQVADIIRMFASTIQTVKSFVQSLPPHWTDVNFKDGDQRRVEEVEVVLQALRDGLEDMVAAFGEHADYLGIRAGEMRAIKECIGGEKKEMEDVGKQ